MIGIISDIHGNCPALLAVLNELEKLGVKTLICLGDVAGYYSQVNECCELLQNSRAQMLMGNHDWYLTSGEGCPRSSSANRCLDYQRATITGANLLWLSRHKSEAMIQGISFVHGGWRDPLDEYMKPSSGYFKDIPGTLFASGHTHIPMLWEGDRKAYCNPGSVGQPRDGDPRASFAVFHEGRFSLHRVPYDVQRTQEAMKAAGFSAYFYENLAIGTRLGGMVG
ncbi:metallophosphoesterase family protein [Neorhizobium sp. LjRoot104]|uniref:metallophosphoesterase family protein n=1 Tax=Neorhizobium sp. LjRoot104 TaxID=3342254 RepID=UPI003ED0B999